ncbi:FlgD immunoglobulin-like domain containing protein [Roseibium salinum]|nr:FlgD immunoglobulin-like domain containing protein [Roseibium salinum]
MHHSAGSVFERGAGHSAEQEPGKTSSRRSKSNQSLSYVSYIGNKVSADASSTVLSGGQASWDYELKEDASGTFEIRNSSGAVVYSGDVDLTAGSQSFVWAGQTDVGADAVEGIYTISFDVKDAGGRREKVMTEISGIVDAVDMSTGEAVLSVDGKSIPVSSVISVSRPS